MRHALLLSAGLGTRLRPLTLVRAKPALPVAGVPMARRVIAWLAGAGITDVVLNVHYLPETIASVVGDGQDLGVRARYSWEQPIVLGSAGGVRQALDIIGEDSFLVVNSDTLTDLEIEPMVAEHRVSGALVTLAVTPNLEPHRYSGLLLAHDGAVLGVEPRGSSRPSFHFIGVQAVHASVFEGIPKGVAANSVGQIYLDVIAAMPGSIRGYQCQARFWDIGTIEDYWTTCHTFAARESSHAASQAPGFPSRGPVMPGAAFTDARVIDSIVWDHVILGAGCSLTRCIVTDGVRIPPDTRYTDSILLRGQGSEVVAVPFNPDAI